MFILKAYSNIIRCAAHLFFKDFIECGANWIIETGSTPDIQNFSLAQQMSADHAARQIWLDCLHLLQQDGKMCQE